MLSKSSQNSTNRRLAGEGVAVLRGGEFDAIAINVRTPKKAPCNNNQSPAPINPPLIKKKEIITTRRQKGPITLDNIF